MGVDKKTLDIDTTEGIKYLSKIMKENEIVKLKVKLNLTSLEIELTKEGIARYQHEKSQKGIKQVEKSERIVKKKEKDEYKEFIMGSDKLVKSEIGELYGL